MESKIVMMVSIFGKNTYLVDLLGGITDFHNHILPGIDDGAKTVEESISLIKEFENIGINKFVATPHVMNDYYPNTIETIEDAFKKLKSNLSTSTHLDYSAEYMMDQNFTEIIENQNLLPIKDNKVLVEMSYFQPPININQILFNLQNNLFSPILAHPERYTYWHSRDLEKYKNIKSRGCNFQLNMLSLSNHYGKGIHKIALRLIENDLIDYISSDAHKLSHIENIKTIKISKKHIKSLNRIINNGQRLFAN
ncbi:tyrosine-protein phosphatase [Christiangramia forsetii]|uniref:protein-tyrosine-phosphatase n=2 Tax=Christiangramia forsetii TaxID=411153 RepID=A0M2V2_CHRFK|nr:CpsB/CapC family capsule biosynthesis tyrosine phosphatase [Christiangramia forsetii]CAL66947.1 protein-tyrosine phosphatase [Christiangramia forsetii KT0803]